jgi:hypothetical protein
MKGTSWAVGVTTLLLSSSCSIFLGPMDMPIWITGTLGDNQGSCVGAATIDDREPYWRSIAGAFKLETVANPGTTVHVRVRCADDLIFDRAYKPQNRIDVGTI